MKKGIGIKTIHGERLYINFSRVDKIIFSNNIIKIMYENNSYICFKEEEYDVEDDYDNYDNLSYVVSKSEMIRVEKEIKDYLEIND